MLVEAVEGVLVASWNFADNEHTVVLTSDDYDAKFSGGHIGNEYQVKAKRSCLSLLLPF